MEHQFDYFLVTCTFMQTRDMSWRILYKADAFTCFIIPFFFVRKHVSDMIISIL